MSARSSDKAVPRGAVPFVSVWGVSPEEWLAYERDMNSQDDYEQWIMEMEGEASDACKLTADLKTSNTPG